MGKSKCTMKAIKRKIEEMLRKNGLESEIEEVEITFCSVTLPTHLLDIEDIEKIITGCGYYFAYLTPHHVVYEKPFPYCY